MIHRLKRAPLTEILLLTRQLALMLRAGIPISAAIGILSQHKRSSAARAALCSLREAIEQGESIAAGMRLSPHYFPTFYSTLVAAGEHAGILDQTLDTLGDQIQAQRALRSRIIKAAIYPVVVCLGLMATMTFLLLWVVPTFEELFAESGVPLPWLTRFVLSLSRNLSQFGPLATLTILAVAWSVVWWFKSRGSAGAIFERLTTRLPLWRNLLRAKHSCEVSGLLAALIRVGIPILEGLAITAQTIPSERARAALLRIRNDVGDGHSLCAAFKSSEYFPELLGDLIEVGEISGSLELMLIKAADFYRAYVDQNIDTLKQLVEPALILIIGALVGVTVLALYLPIFQIGEL
jgi:type IV pilus assembly protein PilC